MAMITDASLGLETEAEGLAFAREVLRIEADALERVRDRLGVSIARAADLIFRCPGSVIVTGMGKAGLVGQKLAATLASTGTRAFPLHPAEAVHGDLGRIRCRRRRRSRCRRAARPTRCSGCVPALRTAGGVPGRDHRAGDAARSASAADLCIALGPIEEACPLGLAPSASTTALMAVGDALALLVSRMRDFRAEDFALYHPAGSLGRKLGRVEDVMRTGRQIRRARPGETVREVFVRAGRAAAALRRGPGRRRRRAAAGHLHRQRPRPAVRDAPRGRPRPADRRGDDPRPGPGRPSARRSPRRSRRSRRGRSASCRSSTAAGGSSA